jgi:hypothetical protein
MGMGMALSMSSSLSVNARQASLQASYQLRQHDMAALKSAINSGDLSSAEMAYSTLTQNTPNLNANSPLAKLGQSLQAGNLSQAQEQLAAWGSKPNTTQASSPAPANSSTINNASAIPQALLQSLGSQGLDTTQPQSEQAGKAVDAFMQNLMALAAQQRQSSPQTPTQSTSTQSASTVMSQAFASSRAKSGAKASGHHHGGGHGGGKSSAASASQGSGNSGANPISGLLSTLASVTASSDSSGDNSSSNSQAQTQLVNNSTSVETSTESSATPSTVSSSALSALSESFQNMVSALGGDPQTTSMSSFLTALSQNLDNMPSSGNFINVTA